MQRLVLAVLVCLGVWVAAGLTDRLVAGQAECACTVERADADLPAPADGAWHASPDPGTVLAVGFSWTSAGVHAVLAGAPRHHEVVPVPTAPSRPAHPPAVPPHLHDIPLLI